MLDTICNSINLFANELSLYVLLLLKWNIICYILKKDECVHLEAYTDYLNCILGLVI